MRVIFNESHRLAEALFPLACEQWPDEDIAMVVMCFPYFASKFDFPRTLRYQDLPQVRDPAYKLRRETIDPLSDSFLEPFSDSFLVTTRIDGVKRPDVSYGLQELLLLCGQARSAVFANCLFYQPVQTFELFVSNFMPHLVGATHKIIDPRPWEKGSLAKQWGLDYALGRTSQDADYQGFLSQAQVKRYFDYNFHLNGNVVFGDLYRKLSGSTAPIHMSKNMVLVLYLLRKLGTVERWGFEHIMCNWRGWKREGEVSEIGTIPSRQTLVPNLVQLGLVKTESLASSVETVSLDESDARVTANTRDYHSLTNLGLRFCEGLHKDCYDPFLPQRLEQWQASSLAEAKPQIDRYLKTYFGKQIRFQSKLFSA
jgi:hypothetical protein